MKARMRTILLASICLPLQGCVTADLSDHLAGVAERMKGPRTEKEWNANGIWYRIENDPPTYLPVGHSQALPRTEKEGIWIVDERESAEKRLFVPHGGANDYSFAVLEADAKKVCHWQPRRTKWRESGPILLAP